MKLRLFIHQDIICYAMLIRHGSQSMAPRAMEGSRQNLMTGLMGMDSVTGMGMDLDSSMDKDMDLDKGSGMGLDLGMDSDMGMGFPVGNVLYSAPWSDRRMGMMQHVHGCWILYSATSA